MPDDRKVVDISRVREEQEELETCRRWDDFKEAAAELYEWRDYESLVLLLQSIEKVKTRIVR